MFFFEDQKRINICVTSIDNADECLALIHFGTWKEMDERKKEKKKHPTSNPVVVGDLFILFILSHRINQFFELVLRVLASHTMYLLG